MDMSEPSEVRPSSGSATASAPARGHHKVYVGMAAGVGKTFRALQELRELQAAGRNVVVGYLETHGREETRRVAEGLPVFPRREVQYKGAVLVEMDVDGLLSARPDVVMVDELAHANAPGSRNAHRYEDVAELLAAGISVISTVNIQHVESLNDLVVRLTGVRVRDRLPDVVLQQADEVILVDLSPQALRERLRQGRIYAPEKVDLALKNFFTVDNLAALRELALRQVADVVEAAAPEEDNVGMKERILVACAAEPESGRLVRRGGRIARRLKGDLDVVYVESGSLTREQQKLLENFRAITESLGGTFTVIPNRGGIGRTLVEYVSQNHVTQVVIGESSRSRLQEFLRGSIVHRVLRDTRNVDVYVITRE
ncbi:universal stress protein [Deinococcus pimensis]|uniref:universal stress protein n=1 Tax=Deinococcus pimensis TaxID=309888 RepID=UPI00316ABC73